MNCNKCNAPIPAGQTTCAKCGTPVKAEKKSNKKIIIIIIVVVLLLLLLSGGIILIIALAGLGWFISSNSSSNKSNDETVVVEEVVEEVPTNTYSDNSYDSSDPYAWLSERYVTDEDLVGVSRSELRIMRNAIFAHHGYRFRSPDLQEYFAQYDWYSPQYDDVSSDLSTVENYNVQFIKQYE